MLAALMYICTALSHISASIILQHTENVNDLLLLVVTVTTSSEWLNITSSDSD